MLLPFCDMLYYFLNPKILLKIFFTTFSFFCGFTTGSYLREPCLSPFFLSWGWLLLRSCPRFLWSCILLLLVVWILLLLSYASATTVASWAYIVFCTRALLRVCILSIVTVVAIVTIAAFVVVATLVVWIVVASCLFAFLVLWIWLVLLRLLVALLLLSVLSVLLLLSVLTVLLSLTVLSLSFLRSFLLSVVRVVWLMLMSSLLAVFLASVFQPWSFRRSHFRHVHCPCVRFRPCLHVRLSC